MKKTFFLLSIILPLMARAAATGIIFGSNDAGADRINRTVQYYPTPDGYIATDNGTNLYTRALYGGHSLWRLETSDRPIFAAYHKKDNRNISFFVEVGKKGQQVDLQDVEKCTSLYRGGERVYRLSDPAWKGGTVEITALARHDAEGAIWKIVGRGMPRGSRIVAVCGPTVSVKLSRSGDLGADPKNAFAPSTDPDRETAECGVEIGGKSATAYILYDDRKILADNQKDLAQIFDKAASDMTALTSRISVSTPDPWVNTLGANLAAAADGIWDGDTYQHGAIGWRMPLAGWRGAYTGDFLGWHDRARNHFNAYSESQVTNVPPVFEHPTQDSTLAMARAEKRWGTQMYSNGYICRNPRRNDTMHHYDMNLCFIDELLWHLCWTGDVDYARQVWPVIKRSLEWEKRNYDPDDDGLYDAYCCIWASDALYYNGGGVTHSSAYNYRANRLAAEIAALVGEDPAPYAAEADKIKTALQGVLWIPGEGVWAEYKDTMGHGRLHDHPAVWTVYHAIDSDVATPLEYYAATRYIDRNIPRFPITTPGDSLEADGAYVVSTTNWLPYSWSINNVAHAETLNTALAYWQARRPDEAFKIFKGMILDGMFLGDSPGNIGQISHYDAARGESYRDFADPVGVMSRALVQGLFGFEPDMLNRHVTITPGFPSEWAHASMTHPDFDLAFKRDGMADTYSVDVRLPGVEETLLTVPVRSPHSVATVDGKQVEIKAVDNSVGRPLAVVAITGNGAHRVEITWEGDAIDTGKATATGEYVDGFYQVGYDGVTWWKEIPRMAPREINPADYGLELMTFGYGSISERVDLGDYYNASVGDIFKQQYLSPRPSTTTLRLPAQGIGEWCHPLDSANIDDSGFRSSLIYDGYSHEGLLSFKSRAEGNNIIYTSLFDNYPDSVTIPLEGRADGLMLMLAGSTNHMQCHIENARLTARYTDGSTKVLPLVPPINWCPIEQDYYIDDYAFKVDTPRPLRVALKTGEVSDNLGEALNINEVYGRRIDGGAATVLCMHLDREKELESLTLETLSNDVVVGLMGVTYIRHYQPPMEDINNVVDNTPDSIMEALTARPVPGSTRRGDNPVLFLVGNSTMRTGTKGNGNNGQWGWGFFAPMYFDSEKITVENQALGGMSSRTFYNRLWRDIEQAIRPGDYVVIELGHNDNGPYDSGRARATIPGIGRDSINVVIQETGEPETVYSYGEYMRRYINDVKRRGATPILMSLTPRNAWDDADSTIVTRVKDTYGLWARQVAEEENVPFVDLNEITARKFEQFGKEKVKYMFYLDRIHTSTFGAQVNAESAAEGIAACPELADLAAMIVEPEYPINRHVERQPGARFVIMFGNVDTEPDLEADGLLQPGDCTIKGFPLRWYVYSGIWDAVYRQLQPNDIVLINFDNELIDKYSPLEVAGMLPGWGDATKVVKNSDGMYEVVYTEGWYLKKIVGDALEQGAIPVIIADPDDEIARHVARSTSTMLVDRNNPKIVISE